MIYFRCYIEAYERHTRDLSMIEDGAYNRLMRWYFLKETPLPLKLERIYEIARAISPEAQEAVQMVVSTYFNKQADGYHNERADHEIAMANTARENGSKGGRPAVDKPADKPPRKTRAGTGRKTGEETGHETGGTTEPRTEANTGTQTGEVTRDLTGTGHPFSLSTNPEIQNHQGDTTPPEAPARGGRGRRLPAPRAPAATPEPQPAPPQAGPNGTHHDGFASDGEIPWWHTPAGIQRQGTELGITVDQHPEEAFGEYKARVIAASGPGPWEDEQPPPMRERVEFHRAHGGFA